MRPLGELIDLSTMFSSKPRGAHLSLIATFSLLLSLAQARPISLPSWLTNVLPEKGATLADEIKCYSLPYGGIGFTSHVLTYWTILVLGFGRKPYWPWRRLSAGKFDLFLSITQVIITVAVAAFTIARCRSRWQFILIAVWKLVMSMVVGVWGISASRNAIRAAKYNLLVTAQNDRNVPRIWSSDDLTWLTLFIYAAAAVVGLVGLISLVVQNFWLPRVWKITTVFGSLILAAGLAMFALWWCVDMSGKDDFDRMKRKTHGKAVLRGLGFSGLGVIPTLMLILAAFYSDWVLGAFAGSLVGVPSGDNAYLYWVSAPIFSATNYRLSGITRHTLQRNGYRSSLLDLARHDGLLIVMDEVFDCSQTSRCRGTGRGGPDSMTVSGLGRAGQRSEINPQKRALLGQEDRWERKEEEKRHAPSSYSEHDVLCFHASEYPSIAIPLLVDVECTLVSINLYKSRGDALCLSTPLKLELKLLPTTRLSR
jgi:hypothetical protein